MKEFAKTVNRWARTIKDLVHAVDKLANIKELEVNFLTIAKKNGTRVLIVGEAERRRVMAVRPSNGKWLILWEEIPEPLSLAL
ncbi:MAG: hypothetical protein N2Z40_02780 [Caldimicrobium sp.]|nr:hypothetical protein [Caldimicrobium sp.]MCX7613132.1 hypothetical protein [Caldimicrobium sp.]MDW8183261.1 hypothetical protein [Caldimicrobium sp.]